MKLPLITALLALACTVSCQDYSSEMTRNQVLSSGKTVKLLGVHFGFGSQENKGNDSFTVEYSITNPKADDATKDKEAWDVFELIRPVSEQWGLKEAEVSAFPTPQHKGAYTFYRFRHSTEGKWAMEKMNGSIHSF